MTQICPLCECRLYRAKDEHGDYLLRRGMMIRRCRNGHHFTAIPRPDKAAVVAAKAAA